MKMILRVIFILVLIIGVIVVARNMIGKVVLEQGVRAAVGTPLKIGKLDLGLAATHIGITDLKLYNPKGFPEEVMFYAPEIFVDYQFGAFLRKKVHLQDVRFNFDQFVIVKNKDGKTNIGALQPKAKGSADQPSEKKPAEEKKGPVEVPEVLIDHLFVKVGKVVYKDYSGAEPSVKEFKVNLNEEFHDVSAANMNWLIMMIVNKAILKTNLSGNMDFMAGMTGNVLGGSNQSMEELKGTVDTLKETFKLPFGGGQN